MKAARNLDELIRSVSLHNRIAAPLHLYLLPFLVAYPLWIYAWIGIWGFWEHYEAGFVGIAAIGCLQILSCLACYWSVHIRCFFTCKKEQDPLKATLVKVVPTENNGSSEIVPLRKVKLANGETMIHFVFQKTKYVWNADRKQFRSVEFPIYKPFGEYATWRGHQDDEAVRQAEIVYGTNAMDVAVPEFTELFTERATAPFFVFQIFCVALWCLDKYWYYSIFTLVMLVMFECTLVQQQLKNMAEIRKMGNAPYNISVYRNRRWRTIPSSDLVPGDVISIVRAQKDNYLVPCDVVLLRGTCIVDESMLTGESVPQMKEPIEGHHGQGATDSERILDPDADGKLHVLFGGTKVVQHSPPPKATQGLRAPDNGCVAYALRTSFNTAQGKLLRTIMYGAKRVTANNRETFGFIVFLLVFALAAAAYVWRAGVANPARNRYKLFLECTLILTSVIPPELPIELSLAVNTSLLALSKLAIFCTEPFRIPFAGKVDVCCFDKTGTLTSDSLVVEGVALARHDSEVTSLDRVPMETTRVLVTCHALVQLEEGLVGDPLEKATLTAADWTVTRADCVVPRKGKAPGFKIFVRYHFTALLRRMSVVAGFNAPGSAATVYFAAVKGAPEVVKGMLRSPPANYDRVYLDLSRRGARVLALAHKHLGDLTTQQLRDQSRDAIEADLDFVGFVIISCPLKADSGHVIAELQRSTHRCVIITGDNALTACHVAEQLRFTTKPIVVLQKRDDGGGGSDNVAAAFHYESVHGNVALPADHDVARLIDSYDVCVTGDSLDYLKRQPSYWRALLPHVTVFARFAPKQKEFVVTQLNASGRVTLMCGDGTNDVGALKHAQVGVAILANAPERLPDARDKTKSAEPAEKRQRDARSTRPSNVRNVIEQRDRLQNRVNKLMRELEEEEQLQVVKLGDASIASPFTSKLSSIMCVCHIIKQGRCTLVTTLQMFKILALNALILAYTQSVLYLDGIKLRDMQATLQGILLASSFLFISRSKPLKTLSKQRPLPNIFNLYTIATVLLQFAVHFVALIYLVQMAKARTPVDESILAESSEELTEEEEYERFQPNLINSTVFVISMALQLATFAINYRGKPYMESLVENKLLLWSILISSIIVIILTLGIMPELSAHFEIIQFPDDFKYVLLGVLFADLICAYLIDRICLLICGEGKSKIS